MVALSLQTLLLMGGAYLLGAIVACAARRTLARAPAQSSATAERRVDPLPEMVQAGTAQLVQPVAETRPPVPETAPIEPEPAPVKPAIPTATTARPAQEPVQPAQEPTHPAQDLTRIQGIDAVLASALSKLGITRYEQIAAWMRGDIERIEQSLEQQGRTNRENWIEQAQILAKGGETRYASRRARGETANAKPTPHEGEHRPIVQAAAATTTPLRAPITVTARPAAGGAAAVAAEIIAPKPVPPPVRQPEPATPPRPETPVFPPDVASRAAFAEPRPLATLVAPKTAPVAPTATAAATSAPAEPAVPIRPAAPMARDNLQRISGIDAQTEQRLAAQAVTRYSQIAHWSPSDVERFERLLGTSRRIARENWIEQAQILSRGGDTAFSREFDRREAEAAAQLRPAKLTDAIREHSAAKSSEVRSTEVKPVEIKPAEVEPTETKPTEARPIEVEPSEVKPTETQPAEARPVEVMPSEVKPTEAKPGETRPSERLRSAPRPDLGSLRSVRSEAYQTAEPGPEAARRVASLTKVVRSAALEDLKRIRGIGVLIEKKLNSMGVVSYEQIANWSAQDIDRVSQSLDFKGRIERENWVEQARILASGGATEFSRRVDRGEIETSRPKS
jgi:predicted flap endonuclease-1-like 5' DNA nuclease